MENMKKLNDCQKLWDRIKLIYDSIKLISDQLKGQFDSFNATYRNIKRYFSTHFSRNPSEIEDLINISLLKSDSSSSMYNVYLEDTDFRNVEQQLSIYNSLRNLHDILTGDVIKIMAKEHSEYFQQPKHYRGFNKVLQCMDDVKESLKTLERGYTESKLSCSQSDLPPQEKLWYLHCLIEREILTTCGILESVDIWERSKLKLLNNPECTHGFLPKINGHKNIQMVKTKSPKPIKKYNAETSINHWQDNLRNNAQVSPKTSNGLRSTKILDQHLSDESDYIANSPNLIKNLKICKWNFRQPAELSREYRPLCNKVTLLRNKNAVSKPHSVVKPYFAKISVASTLATDDEDTDMVVNIEPFSGRILPGNYQTPRKHPSHEELRKINQKLLNLQESINCLITDQEEIDQIVINPLRDQVKNSLNWLRSLYDTKSNTMETLQKKINQLKIEKSLFLQNRMNFDSSRITDSNES